MSAHELAMSAAAMAERAAEEREAEEQLRAWVNRDHELALRMEGWRRARELVERSPLGEWFPGVEWEPYMTPYDSTYDRCGSGDALEREFVPIQAILVPSDRPAGTNPMRSTITLGIGEVIDTSPAERARKAGERVDARVHHVPTGEVRVYWASEHHDRDAYVSYWVHRRVKSAGEVGELYRQRREEAGDQWLGE